MSILLIASAGRWQIIKGAELKQIAKNNVYSSGSIQSIRGSIYSSDGTVLAYSEPRFDMYIWLKDLKFFEAQNIQTREEFLRKIAPIIDTTPEELGKKIADYESQDVKWMPVAKSLKEEKWKKIIDLKTDTSDKLQLRGFRFEITSERVYPENQLASQIIGLTSKYKDTIIGVSGLEQAWDGELSPTSGYIIQESDAAGRAIASALVPTIEPKSGNEIHTSIDKKLQGVVESKLKDIVQQYEAESGSAVIMNPKTGVVTAIANYPTYNAANRETIGVKEVTIPPGADETLKQQIEKKNANLRAEAYGNSSISGPIEIGSVMKVLTIAIAIDLGLITPETIILPDGHQGCEKFTDDLDALCTWDKQPQPPMPARECFRKSDNICFYHIAKLIPKDKYYEYLSKFGIGKPTGIDLSGESYGALRDLEDWTIGDVAAFSYGHGFQVNMLQATTSVAAIDNKGVRMKPYVVSYVVKNDGEKKYQEPTPLEKVVSDKTADTVSNMMRDIYTSNIIEPWYEYLKAYPVAWKTGSALIADPDNPGCPYCSGDLNNSIVGFDMSDNKSFVMLVQLEKPRGGLSFYNVRPAWLDMFAAVKDIIGVKPIY